MKTVLAWHFRSLDGTTEYLCTPEEVGREYRVTGYPRCCERGLHGCERPVDALAYASGALVCRTLHSGRFSREDDKLCSTRRTVLWQADATVTLHEFACCCAETALLREREQGREPDARSWAAIDAKRRWLRGEITEEQLDAAGAAAWAAWDAARAAARAAARDAWDAARDAARAAWAAAWAARAAAWAAAWAAWDAAWAAAWAAARDAAWAAAWEAQDAELEEMLLRLEPSA